MKNKHKIINSISGCLAQVMNYKNLMIRIFEKCLVEG